MEPTTPKTDSKPAEQNPTRGGSFVRQADGSLELKEETKPSRQKPATEPTGNQEE